MHSITKMNRIRFGVTVIALFLAYNIASAQAFRLVPRNTYAQCEVGSAGSYWMDLINLRNQPTIVIVSHYEVNLPAGWTHSMCMGQICYPDFMNDMADTLEPLAHDSVALDIYALTAGRGTASLFVRIPATADSYRVVCTLQAPPLSVPSNQVPISFEMSRIYPNPFNSSTKVEFSLPKSGNVNVVLFDRLGRQLAQTGSRFTSGKQAITLGSWFQHLSSGQYYIRIETPVEQRTHSIEYIR